MKKITLHEAADILTKAGKIILNGFVSNSKISNIEDNPDNEWLTLSWKDDSGCEYESIFFEGDNDEVIISGRSMYLIDSVYDEVELTIN
jgi:hypothetical protein